MNTDKLKKSLGIVVSRCNYLSQFIDTGRVEDNERSIQALELDLTMNVFKQNGLVEYLDGKWVVKI